MSESEIKNFSELEMQACFLADNASCIQEELESDDFDKRELLNKLMTLRGDCEAMEAYIKSEL